MGGSVTQEKSHQVFCDVVDVKGQQSTALAFNCAFWKRDISARNHRKDIMKKYMAILAVFLAVPLFTSATWAHNQVEQDMHEDVLQGHGTVSASTGEKYVQSESRTGDIGSDVQSYPQDFKGGLAGSPAKQGETPHDDHEDTLHSIVNH
jgi:hypothetical protein